MDLEQPARHSVLGRKAADCQLTDHPKDVTRAVSVRCNNSALALEQNFITSFDGLVRRRRHEIDVAAGPGRSSVRSVTPFNLASQEPLDSYMP